MVGTKTSHPSASDFRFNHHRRDDGLETCPAWYRPVPILNPRSDNVFAELRASTVGLRSDWQTTYPIVSRRILEEAWGKKGLLHPGFDGRSDIPMTYLDSTASYLMLGAVFETFVRLLPVYGNPHTVNHKNAEICTRVLEWARDAMMRYVNGSRETHAPIFVGYGSTGAVNLTVQNLFLHKPHPTRNIAIITRGSHHATQLPPIKYAADCIGIDIDPRTGQVDLAKLRAAIEANRDRLRLVTCTGASNVDGALDDIETIADWVKRLCGPGAYVLVDAAQMLAHHPIDLKRLGSHVIIAASGHKIGAPASPGLLWEPNDIIPDYPRDMGGGHILTVNTTRSCDIGDVARMVADKAELESAGTPNIIGAAMAATALEIYRAIGVERIWKHELELTKHLIRGLESISEVTVFGATDLEKYPRAAVVSFVVDGIDHAIVAKALSDCFNVFTRNGCHCAHDKVFSMYGIKMREQGVSDTQIAAFREKVEAKLGAGDHHVPGFNRASLGPYSNVEDVDRLVEGVRWLAAHADWVNREYTVNHHGAGVREKGPAFGVELAQLLPVLSLTGASIPAVQVPFPIDTSS